MKVAAVQETVTVKGESPVVDVENAKIGERLDNATLDARVVERAIEVGELRDKLARLEASSTSLRA